MNLFFKKSFLIFILFCFLALNPLYAVEQKNNLTTNKYLLNYLSFDELKQLSQKPDDALLKKTEVVLNTPIIDNSIVKHPPKFKNDEKMGEFIRVGSWNIARGFNYKEINQIFTNQDELIKKAENKNSKELNDLKNEINILRDTDIIVLNEVDIGMPRTEYKNIVQEIATASGFNYAYGVEFLEIDPVHLGLGDYKWSEEEFLFGEKDFKVDPKKYKGLHGNAILSKYPILNARIIRLPNAYNWYKGEQDRITHLEEIKRNAAAIIFREEMIREIRIGSRMALVAEIKIPHSNEPLTIVATHIENRTVPKGRKLQLKELLRQIRNINTPLVMAGDFNTTCNDGSPTGVIKEIRKKLEDPHFVARYLIAITNPYAFTINSIANATILVRQYANPTVKNIPVISPNKERGFFNTIEDFEFADGHTFDLRGQIEKSVNKNWKAFANSNQRAIKGFVPTFIFKRPLWVGKYKLDWILVKAYLNNPDNHKGSNKFAPHFGRTLYDLNYSFEKPLSDHAPITVDLPINEYKPIKEKSKKKIKPVPDSDPNSDIVSIPQYEKVEYSHLTANQQ